MCFACLGLQRAVPSLLQGFLGSFSSFSQREDDGGVGLAALELRRAEREKVFKIEAFSLTLALPYLSLLVFSSLMLGPSKGYEFPVNVSL